MGNTTPRLRMFAGPNGSGKSTIKDELQAGWIGYYINPDEIEKIVRQQQYFDCRPLPVAIHPQDIQTFFCHSRLLADAGLAEAAKKLTYNNGKLDFSKVSMNSYSASVLSDFLRRKMLENQVSFSFETVMSSRDKVEFLKLAQAQGFRTYLYYVATEDPAINVARVRHRVRSGGHFVPEDKIIARYARSIGLLAEAVKYSNRAFIFDNSHQQRVLIAEISDGDWVKMMTPKIPGWFETALLQHAKRDHAPRE